MKDEVALAAEWRDLLTGLDAHQHLTGPPVVDVDGDESSVDVHVVGAHVLEGDPAARGWSAAPIDSPSAVARALAHRRRQADTPWQTGDSAVLERAASAE